MNSWNSTFHNDNTKALKYKIAKSSKIAKKEANS